MSRGSNLRSVMTKDFSRIPAPQIQRSVFNRTHGHKTTFNAGYLVPFYVDEVLPGDTVSLNANVFARLSTMIFPIMDNVFLDTFYFFVPNRLLWTNWERFQGAKDDPDDVTEYEVPIVDGSEGGDFAVTEGSLWDFFGLPIATEYGEACAPTALFSRAYNLIYNEWFRDQNLQEKVVVDTGDGPDLQDDYVLLRRGKRHDYFTSCLPWPQKGDSVSIPLGTSAPVIGNDRTIGFLDSINNAEYGLYGGNGLNGLSISTSSYATNRNTNATSTDAKVGTTTLGLTKNPLNSGMIADLSTATSATINQLREAFATQQILEMDARGGTRYVEHLKAHWGVTSPDFRLQRPEYLGGSSQRVDVRGVAQTSASPATPTLTDVQAGLASYAQVGSRSGFNKSMVEHGVIIGLVNVRADLTYQQGMRRMWSRRTRFDFYMPQLAHLGEQEVLNKEIWFTDGAANEAINNATFGYQERWAEYRYFPSMVTGLFRSDATGTLDAWHLSTDFTALPVLNASFIVDDPPLDRVIAVASEPHILFDSFIEIKHARPMPVYSVPGLVRL